MAGLDDGYLQQQIQSGEASQPAPALVKQAGFWETFTANFDDASEDFLSRAKMEEEAINENFRKAEPYGIQLPNVAQFSDMMYPDIDGENTDLDTRRAKYEAQVEAVRNQYPDLKLKTYAEIVAEADTKQMEIRERAEKLNARYGDGGFSLPMLAGSMAGSLAIPVNLGAMALTAPLTGGASFGTTLMSRMLSTAAIEGAANAGATALDFYSYRGDMLRRSGVPDAEVRSEFLQDILIAGAMGAGLGGIGEAVGAGLSRMMKGRSARLADELVPVQESKYENPFLKRVVQAEADKRTGKFTARDLVERFDETTAGRSAFDVNRLTQLRDELLPELEASGSFVNARTGKAISADDASSYREIADALTAQMPEANGNVTRQLAKEARLYRAIADSIESGEPIKPQDLGFKSRNDMNQYLEKSKARVFNYDQPSIQEKTELTHSEMNTRARREVLDEIMDSDLIDDVQKLNDPTTRDAAFKAFEEKGRAGFLDHLATATRKELSDFIEFTKKPLNIKEQMIRDIENIGDVFNPTAVAAKLDKNMDMIGKITADENDAMTANNVETILRNLSDEERRLFADEDGDPLDAIKAIDDERAELDAMRACMIG